MSIKKLTGIIINVEDVSKTAKEVSIALSEPIHFIAGSFVNVFMYINGEKVRRAYSISSSPDAQSSIALTLRLSPSGVMTPLFWNKNMIGETVEIMGPLGLNTVDKMYHKKIYLCAFGVGAGVVKSIADYFSHQKNIEHLTILTGSKSEDEILYKEYFDTLSQKSKNISVMHVVSKGSETTAVLKGYIQDHLQTFDFNNADVYVCGQEKACNDLVEKVTSMHPVDCQFFIEGFH